MDITKLARAGANRLEVGLCKTLANPYVTMPTSSRGATASGLRGP